MDYKLLFFDTETTGNGEKDCLCQIAWKDGNTTSSELFKPSVPISIESMAVHHITPKMVAEKPEFKFSPQHKFLHDRAHDTKTIFVAHNAPFDLKMLKKEGIMPERFICTLRVARALDTEGKISSYRLQFLRYLLEIEIEATAHDALGDVLVLEQLFVRLLKKVMETKNVDENAALEHMMEISSVPTMMRKFNFGKYKDRLVEDVAVDDRGYLEWLYAEKKKNEGDEEDWVYTLGKYLGK